MRIIGGNLRNRTVMPPKGFTARPTTDFAKEGLFNILENSIDLSSVQALDLFSGSGSIALEMISRGCQSVTCVEMNRLHALFIRQAAKTLGVESNITVVHHNVFDFIPLCRMRYNLIFADPPYAIEGLDSLPQKIFEAELLLPDGLFILEHPANYSFASFPYFEKEKKYGNVHFSFFANLKK